MLTSIAAHKAIIFSVMSMPQNQVEIAPQLMICWFFGGFAMSLCLETHLLHSMKSKLGNAWKFLGQAVFLQGDMFDPWQRAQQLSLHAAVLQDENLHLCRYLSTHRYNISLMHLVDQIASPYPKALMEQRTSLNLDAWPTPADYYYNIREPHHETT